MLQHPDVELYSFPASDLAERHLGRPIANVGMVSGFASITGALTKESVQCAIQEKFPGKLGELNAQVASETFDYLSFQSVQG
jgi:pyruvate ferredoxin oxidoreductase gamma subunit